jgi:sialate O-acetylesterase
MRLLSSLLATFLCVLPLAVHADIQLPHFFSDGMVLQRDQEVPVWGKADRGENIRLVFQGKTYTSQADRDGRWKIMLPPTPAGGPHSIALSGKNNISLNNILFGDVYLAGGQSNMEWELYKLPEALQTAGETAQYPEIRLFMVQKSRAFTPQDDVPPASWHTADSSSVLDFSAVAYYFARELQQQIQVPIGLIGSYWGGTAIEAWMSREVLDSLPPYRATVAELLKERKSAADIVERYEKDMDRWIAQSEKADSGYAQGWYFEKYDHQRWPTMTLPAIWEFAGLPGHDGAVWFRRQFFVPSSMQNQDLYLHLPRIDDQDQVWVNGKEIGGASGPQHRVYQIPRSALGEDENSITVRVFDSGYQGGIWGHEEDFYITDRQQRIPLSGEWHYRTGISHQQMDTRPGLMFSGATPMVLYNAMIAPLIPFALKGVIWYQGESNAGRAYEYRNLFPMMIRDWRRRWQQELPFLYVQLANYMQAADKPGPSKWAELREAQAMTLSLPNTAMATAIDLGEADNVHPANKKEVGRRLALAARKLVYQEQLIDSGPVYDSMEVVGNQIIVTFDIQGSPLKADDLYGYLKGFSLARADRKFERAKAYILNENTVVVYHDSMINPVAVRYGWADNPHDINLYNEAGLPALPFRSDDWPGVTYESAEYSMQ